MRSKKTRKIEWKPGWRYFTPVDDKMMEVEEISLTHDEIEAIRLKDLQNEDQRLAAEKMNVSQPTFSRLVKDARRKIAGALVKGDIIKVQGGSFEVVKKSLKNKKQ
ncbi:MAG: DUF134 domain-containing protein [archaeon]|nr:MAG: DUF134 domain-containing protein [archaeon]